jgi:hypothetical protein
MILFSGNKKAYVGVEHGKKLSIPSKDAEKVKAIAEQYGAMLEGSGGDLGAVDIDREYIKGSWDDKFQKTIKGYPPEFLYTVFTNTEVNKQENNLTKPGMTILEAINKAQDKVGYFKDRKFTAQTIQKFLVAASEDDTDLLDMAQENATKENVKDFLMAGEDLMWPDNWDQYPNNAGKLAKKVSDQRQEFLLKQPSGVFFVGSDHIKDLKKKSKNLTITNKRQLNRSMMSDVSL